MAGSSSTEVTPVLGCCVVCCSEGINHTSGTGTHAEGSLQQRFSSQQRQAEHGRLFSPNPETPENFPAHWQGFCFGCFFPHLSFLLPCQISLVVEESLRLDCLCCSEPLTERLVGAFTSCSQGNILGATLCFASMVQTVQLLINETTV